MQRSASGQSKMFVATNITVVIVSSQSLQFQAAWIWANSISGASEKAHGQIQALICAGAVPLLIELLDAHNQNIRAKAVLALITIIREPMAPCAAVFHC